MHLKKIQVKNFRLLQDVELCLEKDEAEKHVRGNDLSNTNFIRENTDISKHHIIKYHKE